MNGRQARAVRQGARELTVGSPYREYLPPKMNVRRLMRAGTNADGTPHMIPVARHGTVRLDPTCTRSLQQTAKRAFTRKGAGA